MKLITRTLSGFGIAAGMSAATWQILSEEQKTTALIACRRFHADQSIINRIPGKDVSFFGFAHCQYQLLRQCFSEATALTPDWECSNKQEPYMLENSLYLEHLPRRKQDSEFKNKAEICKTWLNDLILENYRRKKADLPIIPVIFCTDIINNPYPLAASAEEVAPKGSRYITHHELSRTCKLIEHPDDRIRAIAQETFQFVKVDYKRTGLMGLSMTISITDIPAPWADPKWDDVWRQERAQSTPGAYTQKDWRKELSDRLDTLRLDGYNPNINRIFENESQQGL